MKAWIAMLALILGVNQAPAAPAAQETQARIDEIQKTVQAAFVAKQFTAINEMARQMREQRTRLADGRWELSFVTDAIVWNLKARDDTAWKARLAAVDEWVASTPSDATPYVAKANLLKVYAWDARGSGAASTVKQEDWRPFRERLAAARQVLESSAEVSKVSPVWYDAMQEIALGQSWPEPAYSSLFNEAVQREPTYYSFYFNAATYFMPRWHGRPGELARFVDDAVRRTESKEGQTLYARIYWSMLWAFKDETFAPGRAEWPRMRQGFQDILRDYPDSWNTNAFAYYACMAEDWPTYLRAKKLMPHFEPRVWLWELNLKLDMGSCSRRAAQALESPARQE